MRKTDPAPVLNRALPVSASAQFTTEIFHTPEQAETIWRELQGSAFRTPYQSFDWAAAWYHQAPADVQEQPLIVVVRTQKTNQPVLVLPLSTFRFGPWRVGRFMGGRHSNFNMGIYRSDVVTALSEAVLCDVLTAAGRMARLDAFAFANQPLYWAGVANPLAALGGQASPSFGYKTRLAENAEAFFQDRLSSNARRKLRQKERGLGEHGEVRFAMAETSEQAEFVLDAFLKQKEEWFRHRGIPDSFAGNGTRAFLLEAATRGERPVELYALYCGDDVAATYGGTVHGGRFCGMFTSMNEAFSRYSPGDLMLMSLIRHCHERGLREFDLGVGEAAYKTTYCPDEETLFDLAVPVTLSGRAASSAWRLLRNMKRWAKHNPVMVRVLDRVRAWQSKE